MSYYFYLPELSKPHKDFDDLYDYVYSTYLDGMSEEDAEEHLFENVYQVDSLNDLIQMCKDDYECVIEHRNLFPNGFLSIVFRSGKFEFTTEMISFQEKDTIKFPSILRLPFRFSILEHDQDSFKNDLQFLHINSVSFETYNTPRHETYSFSYGKDFYFHPYIFGTQLNDESIRFIMSGIINGNNLTYNLFTPIKAKAEVAFTEDYENYVSTSIDIYGYSINEHYYTLIVRRSELPDHHYDYDNEIFISKFDLRELLIEQNKFLKYIIVNIKEA